MQLTDFARLVILSALVAAPAAAQDAPAGAAPEAPATPDATGDEDVDDGATTPDPTEAPAAAEAPAGAEAPAPETGSLTVSSSPPGKVFIDGSDSGLETPLIDHPLPAGTHTIRVVEQATGRSKEITFHLEGGSVLNLNLNLPDMTEGAVDPVAATSQPADPAAEPAPPDAAVAAADEEDDWSWLTVAGWAALGVGTLGLLAGAVILTTPTDPDQGPLGFGLFGAGAGLVLGGSVLLYLDSELADAKLSFFGLGGGDENKDEAAPGEADEAKEPSEEAEGQARAPRVGPGLTAWAPAME